MPALAHAVRQAIACLLVLTCFQAVYTPVTAEIELLGLAGACTPDGKDALRALRRLAQQQAELGIWAASSISGKAAKHGRGSISVACPGCTATAAGVVAAVAAP